jgi:DNA-binding NarL/FixJ family response regulator
VQVGDKLVSVCKTCHDRFRRGGDLDRPRAVQNAEREKLARRIYKLADKGETGSAIAEAVDVCERTVWRYLKKR